MEATTAELMAEFDAMRDELNRGDTSTPKPRGSAGDRLAAWCTRAQCMGIDVVYDSLALVLREHPRVLLSLRLLHWCNDHLLGPVLDAAENNRRRGDEDDDDNNNDADVGSGRREDVAGRHRTIVLTRALIEALMMTVVV